MPTNTLTSRQVAVIGAGAAGLVTARELRREGHKVVVFERESQIGGTWVYNPMVEQDPLSLDPNRSIIHSSLYKSLRTNLARELMGFKDYPFLPKIDGIREPRRFPGHKEVLLYLQDFVREFEIEEMVRFDTEVVYAGLIEDSNKWRVRFRQKNSDFDEEIFDAVVVCNGHFTEPQVADIPDISSWPGKQIHCHNYRVPEQFKDKVVILIGRSASSIDLSREVAGVAKEVHVVSRGIADETYERQAGYDNMWLHSMIKSCHKDGSVAFQNGRVVHADIILHCTGYKYHFPFLETKGIVTVDDNRVGPLYKHIFPPVLAPWLSFVGMPFKVMPFPLFEYQSKWIAGVLSGRIELPSLHKMMEDVEAFYLLLEASKTPKRKTHEMMHSQFEYCNWLAAECGCEAVEEWKKQMFLANMENVLQRPDTYRDQWVDEQLILQAIDHFANNTSEENGDLATVYGLNTNSTR
ncbi:flavin-containing monooxygenase FMO GS-OX-like 4 [Mercurialis annua]|uniref:flavin-containing monooxygenase FMO GS-OX-like 4 n=1 Tax=Mercurialis annua TaxID=3986 RepID=UPI002160B195|nr:flavin-containing monooxygenase FMO GS-OX-like 4 [Mercurialis annua]